VLKCSEEARIKAVYAHRQNDSRYSWFRPDYVFAMHSLEREFLALLSRHNCNPLAPFRILEVGCGTGFWLRQFVKWGARPERVTGVDLLPDRVAEARRLCPPEVTIRCENAAQLDFDDHAFDIVFHSLMFTSVKDAGMRHDIAAQMLRVSARDGLILWYDFDVNNPRNPDVRAVKKAEILQLFPDCTVSLRRVGLAPPLYRSLGPYSQTLCTLLEKLPFLRTHQLGAIRRAHS
jgi:ubiquinone/menaquinone biosynthesis C-methylase UbiE